MLMATSATSKDDGCIFAFLEVMACTSFSPKSIGVFHSASSMDASNINLISTVAYKYKARRSDEKAAL